MGRGGGGWGVVALSVCKKGLILSSQKPSLPLPFILGWVRGGGGVGPSAPSTTVNNWGEVGVGWGALSLYKRADSQFSKTLPPSPSYFRGEFGVGVGPSAPSTTVNNWGGLGVGRGGVALSVC